MDEKRLKSYKKDYDRELSYKHQTDSRLSLPYAIIIVLFGILNFFLNKITKVPLGYGGLIYLLGNLLFIISLCFSVLYLIKCYHGNEYKYMPDSYTMESHNKDYENYIQGLVNDYDNLKDLDVKDIQTEFNECLIENYCECNKHNRKTNEMRWNLLYKANKAIVFCLIASVIAISPIVYKKASNNYYEIYYSIVNKEKIVNHESETVSQTIKPLNNKEVNNNGSGERTDSRPRDTNNSRTTQAP